MKKYDISYCDEEGEFTRCVKLSAYEFAKDLYAHDTIDGIIKISGSTPSIRLYLRDFFDSPTEIICRAFLPNVKINVLDVEIIIFMVEKQYKSRNIRLKLIESDLNTMKQERQQML